MEAPRPSRPIRVLVVDDDDMVRRAIHDYLRIAPDIQVAAVCAGGAEALAFLAGASVDVTLMDVHMHGMDGIAATRAVVAANPAGKVVMLTSHVDDAIVQGAMDAGASGFLMKNIPPEGLVDAVRGVHRGVWVMSDAPMRHVRDAAVGRSPEAPPELNERELEVLRQLCRGSSNGEIARELFMSESSVKGYVTSVLRALCVTTRLRAVVRAHELGLDRD